MRLWFLCQFQQNDVSSNPNKNYQKKPNHEPQFLTTLVCISSFKVGAHYSYLTIRGSRMCTSPVLLSKRGVKSWYEKWLIINTTECISFHTKVTTHDTCEINFVICSFITMYNMWCLLWHIFHKHNMFFGLIQSL
jgi:hypothetical protein